MSQIRTNARRCALQALYQWQVAGQDLNEIEKQFLKDGERGVAKTQVAYFTELLHGVPQHLAQIDATLGEFVDRSIGEIDPVERAILRMGVYELLFRPDVPYRVVLNESINLAKRFGAAHGHKYINGILDKIARQQRAAEVASK